MSDFQQDLFADGEFVVEPAHTTHSGGKGEYLHDWYAYLEGYSSEFVRSVQRKYMPSANHILEPFAGVGTTPITLATLGVTCSYCEVNPAMRAVITAKIDVSRLGEMERRGLASEIRTMSRVFAESINDSAPDAKLAIAYESAFAPSIFFTPEVYELVLRSRSFADSVVLDNPLLARAIEVAVMSVLVKCSLLKRAGDVRYKTKKELEKGLPDYIDSVRIQLLLMASDCELCPSSNATAVYVGPNAKELTNNPRLAADGVITSPPYLNGTNYFRNTKLELWFMRDIVDKSSLRGFRDQVVTSGINDVTKAKGRQVHEIVKPYYDELVENAYDMRIPRMVAGYFEEMSLVLAGLAYNTKRGSTLCVDIGDSIYGGVHVPTHSLLGDLGADHGLGLVEIVKLRDRKSKDGTPLSQSLLVYENKGLSMPKASVRKTNMTKASKNFGPQWEDFKISFPHAEFPYSKRNWGNGLHSVCSYQGKLKPALAFHLMEAFTSKGDVVLDPFSGSGTLPFEASLNSRKGIGLDIGLLATSISNAKLMRHDSDSVIRIIDGLSEYIKKKKPTKRAEVEVREFGFNKKIADYFHEDTLREILLARTYFAKNLAPEDGSWSLVFACMLHILHGNRPYALSRNSHPITPYAPTGDFVYKNLVERLSNKVGKSLATDRSDAFSPGHCYQADILDCWPDQISNVNSIITSPPFFDSTKFYMTNWMRYWFCGWGKTDFEEQPKSFVEVIQKKSFDAYDKIFQQCNDRLAKNGVVVFHLGHSDKCDMSEALSPYAKKYFRVYDSFTESVEHCEKHGISDKGGVKGHQYLVLEK
ncbi:MAG: hypothetical protein DRR42_20265 [Gammaproteobacteria bacterium]|nr:MAG: hypothetical protein DRR42_20265 [Gammaproteobacteria bacterium]